MKVPLGGRKNKKDATRVVATHACIAQKIVSVRLGRNGMYSLWATLLGNLTADGHEFGTAKPQQQVG